MVAKRLFIGLELPKVTRRLLAGIDPGIKGLRWLAADELHLTLSFLGDVDPRPEQLLREALASVHVPPFFLPVQGINAFGGPRPTIVWAGVGKGHPHLSALHKHIQDAVLRAGMEPDLRAFHPHITLARAKDVSHASLVPFLRQHADTEFDFFKVTEFALFSSVLLREGARYRVELRCKLSPRSIPKVA